MAQEIAKLIPVKRVILISSVRSADELPWYFRFAGDLNLHRITPFNLLKKANGLMRWAFWVQDPEHRKLLETIARETSPAFIKWAIHQLLKWNGKELSNVIQIHSDKDRTFPLRYIQHPDIILKGTGHFMIVQRADEISRVIEDIAST